MNIFRWFLPRTPKSGEIWINNENPFVIYKAEIVEVREGFVLYWWTDGTSSNKQRTDNIRDFNLFFKFYKFEPKGELLF